MNTDRRPRTRPGFTLVEVLATLLLVGIVLPVIVRATGSSAQLGVWSQRSATAAALADAKLSELLITGEWEDGDAEGEFDVEALNYDAAMFYWWFTVEDWNTTEYSQLTFTVSWEDGFRARSVSLTTVVNTPEVSFDEGGLFF